MAGVAGGVLVLDVLVDSLLDSALGEVVREAGHVGVAALAAVLVADGGGDVDDVHGDGLGLGGDGGDGQDGGGGGVVDEMHVDGAVAKQLGEAHGGCGGGCGHCGCGQDECGIAPRDGRGRSLRRRARGRRRRLLRLLGGGAAGTGAGGAGHRSLHGCESSSGMGDPALRPIRT